MTKRLNWYKRCPTDWQTGTRGMSLELRGFYSAILDAMWEQQGQLPKDIKWLALSCQCSTRLARTLLAKLIDAGKIVETATGYYNPRMMADILGLEKVAPQGQFAPISKPVQAPFEAEPASNQPRTEREPSAKIQKKPTNTTRVLESESESERKITPLPPKGGSPSDCLIAFEEWNGLALRTGLPQASRLTPDRQRKIAARLKTYGLDGWRQALAHIEQSAFLNGHNDRGWRANLEFVLQAASFSKLHDGAYGNGRHADAKPDVPIVSTHSRVKQLLAQQGA